MNRMLTAVLLLYAVSLVHGNTDCTTGQPPRFTLEPQDAVLPTTRDNEALGAALHCAHDSPNTTLTWYRGTTQVTSGNTRTIHDNGTLEFHPLIANADLTEDGVEYHCRLSNAFGSVISRTAILKLATFGNNWDIVAPPTEMVDVTLGSLIYLPCDPPAANPPPVVEWTRDGTVVDTSNAAKYKVLPSGGGLIIGDVVAADIGPTYQCRVTNALVYNTENSSFTYQLNQVERYSENLTIFDTLQSRYELPLGSTAEFTCLATANDVNSLDIFYRRTDGNRLGDNVDRPEHDGSTIDRRTTLRINVVTVANDAEYECVVRDLTDDGGSIPLGRHNFTIVVTFPPAITSTPSNAVVYTSDPYTIQCGATGVPAPVIYYFFNATNMTTGVPGITVSDGTLTIASVTHDNTGPYQCFADNVRPIRSSSWVVTVRDPAAPVLLGKTSGSTYVTMNTNLTLTVDVSADPSPHVTWQLDGGDLAAMTTITMRVTDDTACPKRYQAQLTVVGFTADHSGIYTVAIENRAGMITTQFERRVEEPAAVTSLIGTGTGGNCIVLGMDSTLTCTYTGVPTATPLWYRGTGDDRVNIPVSDIKYVVTHGSGTTELIIRNVASEDAGKYGCEATNSVNGTTSSNSLEIEFVICSNPSFDTPVTNTVPVTEEDEVRFNCKGEGMPEVTYDWFYENETGRFTLMDFFMDRPFDEGVQEDTNIGFLQFTKATEEDAGTYICKITTELGTAESTFILIVNEPATQPPSAITPMESDSSDVSITVTWDMPMDINIDHYRIEYRVKVDQSDWVAVTVNATLTSYEIMGLSPMTTYEVRIFAISTEGVSSIAADAISITTKAVTGTSSDNCDELSTGILFLIIILCIIILTLVGVIVFIVFVCYHRGHHSNTGKTSMYGTEKTDNPVCDTVYSKDNGLGTDDQQEENPSYGNSITVAMQSNPGYDTATKEDTTATPDPTYDIATTPEENSTVTANVGPVATQSNPAYGVMTKGNPMQSETGTS